MAECRSLDNSKLDIQTQHMVDTFKQATEYFGAGIEIQTIRMYYTFSVDENDQIVKVLKKVFNKINIKSTAEY